MKEQEILNRFLERIASAQTEKELNILLQEIIDSFVAGHIQEEGKLLADIAEARMDDLRKLKHVESILDNAKEIINM